MKYLYLLLAPVSFLLLFSGCSPSVPEAARPSDSELIGTWINTEDDSMLMVMADEHFNLTTGEGVYLEGRWSKDEENKVTLTYSSSSAVCGGEEDVFRLVLDNEELVLTVEGEACEDIAQTFASSWRGME